MAAGKKAFCGKRLKDCFLKIFCTAKSPYPKTHHPKYTQGVTEWLKTILQQKDSVLHTLLDRKKLEMLLETEGSSFQVPWFGQLMKGPQLIAHLAQIHTWFEAYRIDIEE